MSFSTMPRARGAISHHKSFTSIELNFILLSGINSFERSIRSVILKNTNSIPQQWEVLFLGKGFVSHSAKSCARFTDLNPTKGTLLRESYMALRKVGDKTLFRWQYLLLFMDRIGVLENDISKIFPVEFTNNIFEMKSFLVEIMMAMALEEQLVVSLEEGGAENIVTVQDATGLIEKVKVAAAWVTLKIQTPQK
ncbi:hypothetical protein Goari_015493 [Gossypium aridum]|uniref:Uncharacterized protein n=1 Tax=Gossypium aridum TaxID=34290 RepID=A0A7J8WFQ6_GOSAI|nr:hypothetical protein [Gossypium aridum]